ncbi:MAG: xylulokinase [Clostridiales bacterium]|nr:xylulokinase [Clostridiales bacterium]
MNYLLGIDFGGTSAKGTLIDTSGRIVIEATSEYPTLCPEPDMREQSPEDWISSLRDVTREILEKSDIEPSSILCLAIDSATHTFLMTDGDNSPIRDAIHWTDSRSRDQSRKLEERHGEEILEKTFHKPDTIWTLPMICWLREHEPETIERARRVFFEKDYIRFFLTGEYMTDYIEAQGSMLFDCRNGRWDDSLISMAGIEKDILPPLCRPTDSAGKVTKEASSFTGLVEGTPVICGTTDTALEVFASGAIARGDRTVKLATAGRICVITDRPYPNRHLVNYSHVVESLWYPGTATKAAAASYRYFRDTFGSDYATLDREASEVSPGCEGLMYHPYLNGELTPYADPALRASFTGMGSTHTRGHYARAVLEGVAMSLMECKNYLDSLDIPSSGSATLIGGGAKGKLWRQIVADALGIKLRTTLSSDSSLGSAMLAGVACGVFSSYGDAVDKCVVTADTVIPDMENHIIYCNMLRRYRAIQDALAPIYNTDWVGA